MFKSKSIVLIVATFAGLGFAGQAQASYESPRAAPRSEKTDLLKTDAVKTVPCERGFGATGCSTFQRKLLTKAAEKAAAGNGAASIADVGRKQLDALVASID